MAYKRGSFALSVISEASSAETATSIGKSTLLGEQSYVDSAITDANSLTDSIADYDTGERVADTIGSILCLWNNDKLGPKITSNYLEKFFGSRGLDVHTSSLVGEEKKKLKSIELSNINAIVIILFPKRRQARKLSYNLDFTSFLKKARTYGCRVIVMAVPIKTEKSQSKPIFPSRPDIPETFFPLETDWISFTPASRRDMHELKHNVWEKIKDICTSNITSSDKTRIHALGLPIDNEVSKHLTSRAWLSIAFDRWQALQAKVLKLKEIEIKIDRKNSYNEEEFILANAPFLGRRQNSARSKATLNTSFTQLSDVQTLDTCFDKVERNRARVFAILGQMGMGKSEFVLGLAKKPKGLAAYIKFEYKRSSHCCIKRVVQAISRQMCANISGYKEALFAELKLQGDKYNSKSLAHFESEDFNLFPTIPNDEYRNSTIIELYKKYIFNDALDQINSSRKIIYLDGLSQCKFMDRLKAFIDFLIDDFDDIAPNWLSIVITSRPQRKIVDLLESFTRVSLEQHTDQNEEDVKAHCNKTFKIENFHVQHQRRLVSHIVEKSEGCMELADWVLKSTIEKYSNEKNVILPLSKIQDTVNSLLDVRTNEHFQKSKLYSKYYNILEQFKDMCIKNNIKYSVVLGLVLASRGPLPILIFRNATQIKMSFDKYNWLNIIFDIRDNKISFIHSYFKVFLLSLGEDHALYVNVKVGQKMLADFCVKNQTYKMILSSNNLADEILLLEKLFPPRVKDNKSQVSDDSNNDSDNEESKSVNDRPYPHEEQLLVKPVDLSAKNIVRRVTKVPRKTRAGFPKKNLDMNLISYYEYKAQERLKLKSLPSPKSQKRLRLPGRQTLLLKKDTLKKGKRKKESKKSKKNKVDDKREIKLTPLTTTQTFTEVDLKEFEKNEFAVVQELTSRQEEDNFPSPPPPPMRRHSSTNSLAKVRQPKIVLQQKVEENTETSVEFCAKVQRNFEYETDVEEFDFSAQDDESFDSINEFNSQHTFLKGVKRNNMKFEDIDDFIVSVDLEKALCFSALETQVLKDTKQYVELNIMYHLIQSSQIDIILQHLFSFNYIYSVFVSEFELQHTWFADINKLLREEILHNRLDVMIKEQGLDLYFEDKEIILLLDALTLSFPIVLNKPHQLSSQLLQRLGQKVDFQIDTKGFQNVTVLLKSCLAAETNDPWWNLVTAEQRDSGNNELVLNNFIAENTKGLRCFDVFNDQSTNTFAAFGCFSGAVHIYDYKKQEHKHTLNGHKRTLSSISISQDGAYVVSGDESGYICIFTLCHDKPFCLYSKPVHSKAVWKVEWIGDGSEKFMSCSQDGSVWVVDIIKQKSSGNAVYELDETRFVFCEDKIVQQKSGIGDFILSKKRELFIGCDDRKIYKYHVKFGSNDSPPEAILEPTFIYTRHLSHLRCLCFNETETLVASGGGDHHIYIFNTSRKEEEKEIAPKTLMSLKNPIQEDIFSIFFQKKFIFAATGSYILQFDIEDEINLLRIFRSHSTTIFQIKSLNFATANNNTVQAGGARDSNIIFGSVSDDQMFKLWRPSKQDVSLECPTSIISNQTVGRLTAPSIRCIAVSESGKYIVAAHDEAVVTVFSSDTGKVLHRQETESVLPFRSIAISPDETWFAACTAQDSVHVNYVHLWQLSNGEHYLSPTATCDQTVTTYCFDKTSEYLIYYSTHDNFLRFYSMKEKCSVLEFFHQTPITSLCWHPLDSILIAGCSSGSALILNYSEEEKLTKKCITKIEVIDTIPIPIGICCDSSFSPNGNLFSLCTKNSIGLWKVNGQGTKYIEVECTHIKKKQRIFLKQVGFTKDSQFMVALNKTSPYDFQVLVWSASSGNEIPLSTSSIYNLKYSFTPYSANGFFGVPLKIDRTGRGSLILPNRESPFSLSLDIHPFNSRAFLFGDNNDSVVVYVNDQVHILKKQPLLEY